MKALWKYIAKKKLKSKDDGRIIKLDDRLSALLNKKTTKLVKHSRKIESRGKKIKLPSNSLFMTEVAGVLSDHLS